MNEIWTLACKDLRLLLRDRQGFFFTFVFPLIYAAFFGAIMKSQFGGASSGGSGSKTAVLIVDEDNTDSSKDFARRFFDSDRLDAKPSTLGEAKQAVLTGRVTGFIELEPGFGAKFDRLFWGEPATVKIGVDPGRPTSAAMLEGLVTGLTYEQFSRVMTDGTFLKKQIAASRDALNNSKEIGTVEKGVLGGLFSALESLSDSGLLPGADEERGGGEADVGDEEGDNATASIAASADGMKDVKAPDGGAAGGWRPFNIERTPVIREGPRAKSPGERIGNPFNITMPQSMAWALMACAATFGISIVIERSRGTLLRLQTSPMTLAHVLAGKALACFIGLIGVSLIMLLFGMIVFGVRPGSYLFLAWAVLSASICFVGIMMVLSVVGKTEASAGGIGWAVLVVLAMLSGGMMPYEFLPDWMKNLASVSPVKWTILSLEGAVWRGMTFTEMLGPCLILIAIGVACFALGTAIFKRSLAR